MAMLIGITMSSPSPFIVVSSSSSTGKTERKVSMRVKNTLRLLTYFRIFLAEPSEERGDTLNKCEHGDFAE